MKLFSICILFFLTGCCSIPAPKTTETFCLSGVQCNQLILDNSLQIDFLNTAYTRSDEIRGIICQKRNSDKTQVGVFCKLKNAAKDTLQIQFDKFYLVYGNQILAPEPAMESVKMRTYTYHSYYKVPPSSTKDFVFRFIIDNKTLDKQDSSVYFVQSKNARSDTLFRIRLPM